VLLYLLNGVAIARSPVRGLRVGPVVTAALLGLVCLLPNPAHEQYFATLVPFLAMGAGVGFAHVGRGKLLGPRAITAVSCVAAYVVLAEPSLERKVIHGHFGEWNMNAARPLLLDASAREVRAEAARKAGPILPCWPGSALGVAERITPGYENQFARDIASKLEEPERKQRRLFTEDDLFTEVDSRRPAIVVVDRGIGGDAAKSLRQKLSLCGYDPVGAIRADTELYERDESVKECKPAPPAPPAKK
jgi:hypothetical protein